jgi:hypothetical protein
VRDGERGASAADSNGAGIAAGTATAGIIGQTARGAAR